MNFFEIAILTLTAVSLLVGCQATHPAVGHPDAKVLELVIFSAAPQADRDTTIDAGRQFGLVLAEQPGHVSRILAVADNGPWADIVTWESLPEAQNAAHRLQNDDELARRAKPFFAQINMDPEEGFNFSHSSIIARHIGSATKVPEAVELVIFRTVAGVTAETFAKRSRDALPDLAQLPGYRSTQLSVDESGQYAQVVAWGSMHEALSAPKLAYTIPRLAAWFELIDPESTQMLHLRVVR